ncbi:hypothetical protein F4805DRAFT_434646 [Annulohypoxylon moriforme]|nr:hypothetical protein F4805DRAFT_434646 [Annulohypoxylon moriforme]
MIDKSLLVLVKNGQNNKYSSGDAKIIPHFGHLTEKINNPSLRMRPTRFHLIGTALSSLTGRYSRLIPLYLLSIYCNFFLFQSILALAFQLPSNSAFRHACQFWPTCACTQCNHEMATDPEHRIWARLEADSAMRGPSAFPQSATRKQST